MFEFGLYVLGAFLLFTLILPLIGAVIGVLIYIGLPYFGGIIIASIFYKLSYGSFLDMGAFWGVAILWAILLVSIRHILSKVLEYELAWHEGHYLAATTIVLMGSPYRKRKSALTA